MFFFVAALDLERLDLDEVVARAAGDYNGDDVNGEQQSIEDDDDEDIVVEDNGENGGGADETDRNDNSMSVVQALAKGVEVAPSEDGKVYNK